MREAPIDSWLANNAHRSVYCGMGTGTRFRVVFAEHATPIAYGYGDSIEEAFADGLNALMRLQGKEDAA